VRPPSALHLSETLCGSIFDPANRASIREHNMGSIAINVPDFADSDLVFNEAETRAVLTFFWPYMTP